MSNFTIDTIITYVDTDTVYNSLCDLAAADAYHGRRLGNSLWRAADEDTRTSALFWATDILNRQDWLGNPVSYEQALAWPRKYVPNRLSSHRSWSRNDRFEDIDTMHSIKFLSSTEVPQVIQDATAELAQYLIARDGNDKNEASQYDDQLESLTLGGISLNFREEDDYTTDMPYQVYFMVKEFLNSVTEGDANIVGATSVRLVRR